MQGSCVYESHQVTNPRSSPGREKQSRATAGYKRQLFDKLRLEILAARLKVSLDEQLNRAASATVKALAIMKLPPRRLGLRQ